MPPQDGHFFFWGELLLNGGTPSPFPAEAEQQEEVKVRFSRRQVLQTRPFSPPIRTQLNRSTLPTCLECLRVEAGWELYETPRKCGSASHRDNDWRGILEGFDCTLQSMAGNPKHFNSFRKPHP
jgi:hypothetical protein